MTVDVFIIKWYKTAVFFVNCCRST